MHSMMDARAVFGFHEFLVARIQASVVAEDIGLGDVVADEVHSGQDGRVAFDTAVVESLYK